MKKISISAFLLLGLFSSSYAKTVNQEQAMKAARSFYTNKGGNANLRLAHTYTIGNTNIPTVYVFESQLGNGFVVVSAEDRVQPVLGYSTESKFYAADNSVSPEAQYWLQNYSKQIASVALSNRTASAGVTTQWQRLLQTQSITIPSTLATPVAPMLTTLWDQGTYYNTLCPTGTPTGCVATAMAQIMKFWNNPTQGTGQHTYSSSTLGGTMSANFGTTTYDWANMPNQVMSGSTAAQKSAVATLMYHCGVSVEMDYDNGGSGAQVIDGGAGWACSENALKNNFGYKTTIKGYERADFSDTTWHKMLMFEINTGRPILYAGFGQVGGHAFVFDGYDATEMFHINWGWNGLSNGYFEVDDLSPSALGTGGGAGNFNYGQQALVMIEPTSSVLPPNPWTPDNQQVSLNLVEAAAPSPLYAEVAQGTSYTVTAPIKNSSPAAISGIVLYTVAIDTAEANSSGNPNFHMLGQTTLSIPAHGTYTNITTVSNMTLPVSAYYVLQLYVDQNQDMYIVTDSVSGEPTLPLLVVKTPTSIQNVDKNNLINIYPNPAMNLINIDGGKFGSKITGYKVYDIVGKTYMNAAVNTNTFSIDASALGKGMYYIQMNTAAGIVTKPVSIVK
ncbi:thiol protease/hemagglutinin PrtT [Edaphocola aurantiacus]|uniref:thiol protease/hemagglutinin PrtT n=1 Tax=Edaphocola aurantiacus TaxID=2601682 RepID=UPI001C949D63|nr:thiol protease/hemagglutinin PrtT [Edaphocola aurantiacus]